MDYERGVRSSQVMDCEDVNGGQLSSFTLSSQQSSCSMSWTHALEKSWLQQHQDQVPSRSGELSTRSVSGFVLHHWGCSTPAPAYSIGDAVLSFLPSLVQFNFNCMASFCSSGDAALLQLQPAPLGMQSDFACCTRAVQFLLHTVGDAALLRLQPAPLGMQC